MTTLHWLPLVTLWDQTETISTRVTENVAATHGY